MDIKLYNTLSHKKEVFKPLKEGFVGLYTCGPTVYNYAHIGNLRTYIFEDLLKRTLIYNGYEVKHIMNVTDVGHLTSDADTGEDKIEKEAKKEHKSAYEIARYYEDVFKKDLEALNIIMPDAMPRATDYITQQIELIQILEEKGFTYKTSDGIYFDTSKFPKYGKLTGQDLTELQAGARVDIGEKNHPTDFALWKFSPTDTKREMEWESPWGMGFPGWHIECSAISKALLGQPFDIHAGGVDHIGTHHTNEIAQSEAAYNEPLANYWLHSEFVQALAEDSRTVEKMSKSLGNFITLATLQEQGYSPLDYKYRTYTTHWRKPLVFSWTAMDAAKKALDEIDTFVRELKEEATSEEFTNDNMYKEFVEDFNMHLRADLNAPMALAELWKFMKEYRKSESKNSTDALAAMYEFDELLGLGFKDIQKESAPLDVVELAQKREEMRKEKKWDDADKLRIEIESQGWVVEDTATGPKLSKK